MAEQERELVRAVGLWGLVAMCINAVIGSGVFLLPSESYRLLGPFSLWAPLIFALPVFILALCFAEAASHFSEPGGAYLYSRTAFGGFIVIALLLFPHNPIPQSLHLPGRGTDWGGAALFMLFAYAGFENLGVPAGEYKNPRRDLPKALLIGLLIIGAIYVLAQLGAMSAIPNLASSQTPIADAAAALVGTWGAVVITLGAVMSMAGTNSGTVLEGSRMLYALSLDRQMGPISYVHPKYRTPTVAIVVHVIVATILALMSTFANMALFSA